MRKLERFYMRKLMVEKKLSSCTFPPSEFVSGQPESCSSHAFAQDLLAKRKTIRRIPHPLLSARPRLKKNCSN